MNFTRTNLFVLTLVASLAVTQLANFQSSLSAAVPLVMVFDGCDCDSCSSGKRIVKRCPKCHNDFCTLKCKNVVVDKKCFDVDQKIVCIPRITWPWQKCCNPCARTRTVNVLGIKKYQCCECKYIWSVYEPPLPKTPKQIRDEQEKLRKEFEAQNAAQPEFEQNELYDPGGADVPTPPGLERK